MHLLNGLIRAKYQNMLAKHKKQRLQLILESFLHNFLITVKNINKGRYNIVNDKKNYNKINHFEIKKSTKNYENEFADEISDEYDSRQLNLMVSQTNKFTKQSKKKKNNKTAK